jgi:hypothetical protein
MDSESKDDSHPESRPAKKMTPEEHEAWAQKFGQSAVESLKRHLQEKAMKSYLPRSKRTGQRTSSE